FRYSVVPVDVLKRLLRAVRSDAVVNCGGWGKDRGAWVCGKSYWSCVRRALGRARHAVVVAAGCRWRPPPGWGRPGPPGRGAAPGKDPPPRPPPMHDRAFRPPGSPAAPVKTVEDPPGPRPPGRRREVRVAGIGRRPAPRPVPAAAGRRLPG